MRPERRNIRRSMQKGERTAWNIMEKEKIAVIMSAYNEQKSWLEESITSILNQTYQNIHVYIVLDNPENELLHQVISGYAAKDKRITYLKNSKNLGLVGSLNKAISVVTEDYVARMDADDISDKARLEKEMLFLKKHNLDFVMAGADFIYEDGKTGPGDAIPELLPEKLREVQKYGNVSIHSSWLLKKSVYDKLGGYRDVKYCEDLDFVIRALQKQVRIGRMEEHLLLYRLRSTSVSMSYAMEQTEKASYIRRIYTAGESLEEMKAELLNQKFGSFPEKKKERYADAKVRIDDFCDKLYRRHWLACAGNLMRGFISAPYRRIFISSFRARLKINKIYQAERSNHG